MKTVSPALDAVLLDSRSIHAVPQVKFEWNYNRYIPVVAENTSPTELNAPEHADTELFPIKSLVLPQRADKQLAKLFINEGTVYDSSFPSLVRYRLTGPDDVYKYWASFDTTDSSGNFPVDGTSGITTCAPYITYSTPAASNLVQIIVQNHWASPKVSRVRIQTTSGGAWTTIATNPTISNDGFIRLFHNGIGWSSTETIGPLVNIYGIKYEVDSLQHGVTLQGATTVTFKYVPQTATQNGYISQVTTGHTAHLHLIEISARRVANLTDRLVSLGHDQTLGDDNELSPIGALTSNTGSVVLSNTTGEFDRTNLDSEFSCLIEKGAKVTIGYNFLVDQETDTWEYVQEGVMHTDSWVEDDTERNINVVLLDASEYLQTTPSPEMMFSDLTVPQIVLRLLDSVGFTDHNIDVTQEAATVPVFWCNTDKTVWQTLSDLATGTQTAMFFNKNGKLEVLTLAEAFVDTGIDATLYGQSDDHPANIISLEDDGSVGANTTNVTYYTTQYGVSNYDIPVSEQVWTPEDTVTIRSAPLSSTLEVGDLYLTVPAANAKTWPFESMVQVGIEKIRTYGKRYNYYDGAILKRANVFSADEQKNLDKLAGDGYQRLNTFNGNLVIGSSDTTEDSRGVENTNEIQHTIGTMKAGYTTKRRLDGITRTGAATLVTSKSQLNLNTSTFNSSNDVMCVTQASIPIYAGTRLTFRNEKRTHQEAGITLCNNTTNQNGYYICVKTAAALSAAQLAATKAKTAYHRKTLTVYRQVNNVITIIATADISVVPLAPIDLSVKFTGTTTQTMKVYINGALKIDKVIPGALTLSRAGGFGVFSAGSTNVDFDYLYGTDEYPLGGDPEDTWGKQWAIRGGIDSTTSEADMRLKNPTLKYVRKIKKKKYIIKYKQTQWFWDEFGDMVHEIRDFDVKFDPKPVLYSTLYSSNDREAMVTEYNSTPFGAKFRVVNTARRNAVINGDSDGYNNVITIVGRTLTVAEGAKVTGTNDFAVQRDGTISVDIDFNYVQSKAQGQALVDWMKAHWSSKVPVLQVEVLGNPLYEVGDVLAIDYVRKNYDPVTDHFYVISVSNGFNAGLTTQLTLRRRVS